MFLFYLNILLVVILCFDELALVVLLLMPLYSYIISKISKLKWIVIVSLLFIIILIVSWFDLAILSIMIARS
jgi:hypothetical protein